MTAVQFALAACLALAGTAASAAAPSSGTPDAVLAHVLQTRTLACGVLSEPQEYTEDDTHGGLEAFGRDICSAVAAALLGDAQAARVQYYPDEASGYAAVRAGAIDLLLGATPRLTAERAFGLAFGRPVFFDGQGFLVPRGGGAQSLADLAHKQVCFVADTQAEADLHRALDTRHLAVEPFPFSEQGEMEAALVTGHCAAMTGDVSFLAGARARFRARAADFRILPDRITLDPIAPAFRQGADRFGAAVDESVSALIEAEQDGITQTDAQTPAAASPLLAADAAGVQVLGLMAGWSLRAVATVGNYGEMYRRDVGGGSALHLARGPNALWNQGGLLYPLSSR